MDKRVVFIIFKKALKNPTAPRQSIGITLNMDLASQYCDRKDREDPDNIYMFYAIAINDTEIKNLYYNEVLN